MKIGKHFEVTLEPMSRGRMLLNAVILAEGVLWAVMLVQMFLSQPSAQATAGCLSALLQ